MVNGEGQLYTIEGVSAGIIMLVTVYIVLNTTTVFTQGDTAITDMQLQQIGSDALAMMDVSDGYPTTSILEDSISNNKPDWFASNFSNSANSRVAGNPDNLNFDARVYFRKEGTQATDSYAFANSTNMTGYEHAVKVSRWVYLNTPPSGTGSTPKTVLLEVLVWRN